MGRKGGGEYSSKKIEGNLIGEMMEKGKHDPLGAFLMLKGIKNLHDTQEIVDGQKREKRFYEKGWTLCLHGKNDNDLVALWSCWMGNEFMLGYTYDIHHKEENKLIKKILDVDNEKGCRNEFYGKKLGTDVCFIKEEFSSSLAAHKINYSLDSQLLEYGLSNDHRSKPEDVQQYRDELIELAAAISLKYGNPLKLTVDYDCHTVLVPEILDREGYKHIERKEEERGFIYRPPMVKAIRGDEVILLEGGNGLFPWGTYRQLDIPKGYLNKKKLPGFMKDALTF